MSAMTTLGWWSVNHLWARLGALVHELRLDRVDHDQMEGKDLHGNDIIEPVGTRSPNDEHARLWSAPHCPSATTQTGRPTLTATQAERVRASTDEPKPTSTRDAEQKVQKASPVATEERGGSSTNDLTERCATEPNTGVAPVCPAHRHFVGLDGFEPSTSSLSGTRP
jgi:hypothetical protein